MLKPLSGRHYSMVRRRAPLKTSLRNALVWRVSVLENHNPRLVPRRPIKPCVIYTDVCGEGHLGAALCHPVEVTTHGHPPLWMHSDAMGGGDIYEWGMLAALLGL